LQDERGVVSQTAKPQAHVRHKLLVVDLALLLRVHCVPAADHLALVERVARVKLELPEKLFDSC